MRRTLRLLHAAHGNLLDEVDDEELNCGSGGGDNTDTGLRVASLFVILITSLLGALFPVLARRTKWLSRRIPTYVFDTAKYFGSGVIVRIVPSLASILLTFTQIATALIHLLEPAVDELGSPCLAAAWGDYVSTPRLVPELLEP